MCRDLHPLGAGMRVHVSGVTTWLRVPQVWPRGYECPKFGPVATSAPSLAPWLRVPQVWPRGYECPKFGPGVRSGDLLR
ncbi:hypothetical protein ACOMHN_037450 [Nucella lapillus]